MPTRPQALLVSAQRNPGDLVPEWGRVYLRWNLKVRVVEYFQVSKHGVAAPVPGMPDGPVSEAPWSYLRWNFDGRRLIFVGDVASKD